MNRPEVNQKLSKKTVLKEYNDEIERLRRELVSVQEQQGVYVALENYQEMMAEVFHWIHPHKLSSFFFIFVGI